MSSPPTVAVDPARPHLVTATIALSVTYVLIAVTGFEMAAERSLQIALTACAGVLVCDLPQPYRARIAQLRRAVREITRHIRSS